MKRSRPWPLQLDKKSGDERLETEILELLNWNTFFVFRLKGEVTEGLPTAARHQKRSQAFSKKLHLNHQKKTRKTLLIFSLK
ncbi:hypothetical protein AB986_15755 [Alkalihalobacillus macyae]|uniref:Uncharacterized protein n=1 Tax=Guptibacillus hwajinpoensis TaxID=208199 RepID=A0A0J6CVX3_9BACL|nr:hypothetical protein AB986_15755 [Alkalihalobacillus macyae]